MSISSKGVLMGVACGVIVHFLTILVMGSGAVTLGGTTVAAAVIASTVTRRECEEKHKKEK